MQYNAMRCIPNPNLIKEIKSRCSMWNFGLKFLGVEHVPLYVFSSKVVPKAFSLLDKGFLLLVETREILSGSWSES
jgi:hypothetical protein